MSHPGTAHMCARCPKHTLLFSGSFFFIKQSEPAFLLLYTLHCCFEQTFPDVHCPGETPPRWVRAILTLAWTILPIPQPPAGLLLSSLTNSPSASSWGHDFSEMVLPFMVSSHAQHFQYFTRRWSFVWQGLASNHHWQYTGITQKQSFTVSYLMTLI